MRCRTWMLRGLLPVLVLLAASCATPRATPRVSSSGVVVARCEAAATIDRSPEPATIANAEPAARASLCWAHGRPSIPPPKEKRTPYCSVFEEKELARAEAQIRKEFVIHQRPSKLIVDFGCDEAWSPRDVFFEDGNGHGGSFRLVRFRRDANRIEVRAIESQHHLWPKKLEIRVGEVDASSFDAMIARARVRLLAKPHLVRLHTADDSIGYLDIFQHSSNDFHLRLSLVDDHAKVTDRSFTGYDGSLDQEAILPMRLATEPLQELLEKLQLSASSITDDDRVWFTSRFLVTMAGDPYWWVKERYVENAATLGTIDAVPALVTLALEKGDSAVGRTRAFAFDAIATITGWDPRLDPKTAKTRMPEDTARVLMRECAL